MLINWHSVVFFIPFIALAASLVALVIAIIMHVRVRRMFRSANVPDIERLLKLHTKTLEDFVKFQVDSTIYMKTLDDRIKEKMRSAKAVRFNPFQKGEAGSNQSFSSVFADEEGNGVVITSIHTRERTNVFAKPLKNWKSEYELTEEEKGVINQSAGRRTKLNEPKK